MLGLKKRKQSDVTVDDDTSTIAGSLKRVRITVTAGEIRYM